MTIYIPFKIKYMDTTTRTCTICVKTFNNSINRLFLHMKKHLTPEYNHLFSENDIELINQASIARGEALLRYRENYACKVCNKKLNNKQYLICHMKEHLTPETIHLFSEEEIKEIEEVSQRRKEVKKRSYNKMKDTVENKAKAQAMSKARAEAKARKLTLPTFYLLPAPPSRIPIPEPPANPN